MPVIYVLHFDDKLSHAQHYAGCTSNLLNRLKAHANGAGSRLTRELFRLGREWQLGGLYQTSFTNMRKHERDLKDQANAARYCEICSAIPKKIPGTKPYSRELVPFSTRSENLRTQSKNDFSTVQTVQIVRCNEVGDLNIDEMMSQIVELMSADKDALGFIPAGGKQGLLTLVNSGKIILARDDKRIVGYTALTTTDERLNIHQCCTRDEYRLFGLGRKMVQLAEETWTERMITAKVRADLGANEFWQAIGFAWVDQWKHKTSGNPINFYTKGEEP